MGNANLSTVPIQEAWPRIGEIMAWHQAKVAVWSVKNPVPAPEGDAVGKCSETPVIGGHRRQR